MPKIVVAGNCQAQGIAACLRLLAPQFDVENLDYGQIADGSFVPERLDPATDIVMAGDGGTLRFFNENAFVQTSGLRVIAFPLMFFSGYHPDSVYPDASGPKILSPTGTNHSAIVAHSFLKGRTVEQTLGLFNERVYKHLGYYDHFEHSKTRFLQQAAACGLDLSKEFELWCKEGPFLYTPNHPKPIVSASIARALAAKIGVHTRIARLGDLIHDYVRHLVVWPVYPELAARLGIEGDHTFKLQNREGPLKGEISILGLNSYVEKSFELYGALDRQQLAFERLRDPRYDEIDGLVASRKPRNDANPYRNLPDERFWKRSVAGVESAALDPVTEAKTRIGRDTKVATAGSCFAQHIAKRLRKYGFNYFVTDDQPPAGVREAVYAQQGTFSARFGNIYSTRQLLQLMQRVLGSRPADELIWRNEEGRFIDGFRPQIVEGGFFTQEELLADRQRHLAAVKTMFETLDVFVFTLGLTETWKSAATGSVVPIAPGVVAEGHYQRDFTFENLSIDDVRQDLETFIGLLESVNPRARVILTVSPVPLIATYSDRHVLSATTYSKSVLRVAAEHCARLFDHVDYFPSYEIITGNFNRGRYYEDDLREVKPEGVDHVMRVFFQHFTDFSAAEDKPQPPSPARETGYDIKRELALGGEIVCDEELLDS